MFCIGVIPPNPDVSDMVIIVNGHRKSHVNKFVKTYFQIWEQVEDFNSYKHQKVIDLNSRGKSKKPLVTVVGGVADYNSKKVTVLDYDDYEGV